mmetsp:Transcript_2308/g.15340  ORF Transcript_2308/g.15340 Transcript_2308/m.15340 type:complete len:371 (-) Transcript_2308:1593-2705(-)
MDTVGREEEGARGTSSVDDVERLEQRQKMTMKGRETIGLSENDAQRKRSGNVAAQGHTNHGGEANFFSMEEAEEREAWCRTNDAEEAHRNIKQGGFDLFVPQQRSNANDTVLEEEEANNQSTPWTKFKQKQRLGEDSHVEGGPFETDDTSSLVTKLSVERDELQQQLEQLKREMHDVCDELGREIHASKELVQHTNTLKGSIDTLLGESSVSENDQGGTHSRADRPTSKEHSESLDLVDILARLTSKLEGDPPGENTPQLEDALEKVIRAVGQKQGEQTSAVPLDLLRPGQGNQEQRTFEVSELENEANEANLTRPAAPPLSNNSSTAIFSYSGASRILFSRALLWTFAAAITAFLFFAPMKQSELLPVS